MRSHLGDTDKNGNPVSTKNDATGQQIESKLADIIDRQQLRDCVFFDDATWKQLEALNLKNSTIVGIDVNVGNAVAANASENNLKKAFTVNTTRLTNRKSTADRSTSQLAAEQAFKDVFMHVNRQLTAGRLLLAMGVVDDSKADAFSKGNKTIIMRLIFF